MSIQFHSQAAAKAALAKKDNQIVSLKNQLATTNNRISQIEGGPMNLSEILNSCSPDDLIAAAEKAKRGGSKKPHLDSLVEMHMAAEAAAAGRPTATAPTAAAPQASAAVIAKAVVDEQEARAAAAKQKTKAEFDQLTPQAKGEFFRGGGKLISEAAPPVRKSSTPGVKHRAEFNELSPQGRMDFMKAGGKLID